MNLSESKLFQPQSTWFSLLVVILLAAVLLLIFGHTLLASLCFGIALFMVLVAVERTEGITGPLLRFDLVRLARKGRHALLRVVYGLVLLAGLCFTYSQRFSLARLFDWSLDEALLLPVPEMAKLAEDFVLTIVLVQSAAIVLLTPAYLAGAIAEEKERRTLELLFTTHLSDHQIVVGKMLSRMTHLAGLLLTGLPVLSLIQLFGGVSAGLLVVHFLVALLTLLSVGSMCILCSVLSKTVLGAMAGAYAVVFLIHLGCACPPCSFLFSPIGFVLASDQQLNWYSDAPELMSFWSRAHLVMLFPYLLVHGGLAVLCTTLAVHRLRQAALGHDEPPRRTPPPRRVKPRQSRVVLPARMPARTVTIPDAPLLWKEAHRRGFGGIGAEVAMAVVRVFLAAALGICLFGLVATLFLRADLEAFFGFHQQLLRLVGCALLFVYCASVGLQTASSVSRECEQQTLQGLLLLPLDRREILWAKWLGAILRARQIAYYLLAVWALGLVTGVFHPIALLLMAGQTAACVALAASLGLWLSVWCRSTAGAQIVMGMTLFLWFIGSGVLLALSAGPASAGIARPDYVGPILNPFYGLWRSGFGWPEGLWLPNRVAQVIPMLLLFSFFDWVLLTLANRTFEQDAEGRRA